ncbi:hypothetical protein C8N40_103221 [Pontibacter mucosus]|uniref:Uncharacterized protein n=1 Tax=Pontibacter mucosus TaxID=1649266 RepID=A0A2T5YLF7_9BACT|nr:hypothetical protein [Pontibacter mucosus]PTX20146.1 hypothetical protein C8N40_103221 [Pontibacter mucosus]
MVEMTVMAMAIDSLPSLWVERLERFRCLQGSPRHEGRKRKQRDA